MKKLSKSKLFTIMFLLFTFLFISIGCEKVDPVSSIPADNGNSTTQFSKIQNDSLDMPQNNASGDDGENGELNSRYAIGDTP